MIVTRFHYPMETPLISKLDLLCKRLNNNKIKRDAVIICEGAEGEGKTTMSVALAYYISEKTGREFNEKHIFFDVEKMIDFAQNNEKKIIIWDEPALQALSTDWSSKVVRNLTRLLMMARKRRHCFIFNMTKFFKFNEYIVVDRCLFMLHVYSRHGIEAGRFNYIRKKNLERLWLDYRFKKKRNYVKYGSKLVRGTFPDVLSPEYKNNVLSEFDVNYYEREKDKAIMAIGKDDKEEKKSEVDALRQLVATIPGITQQELSKHLGISDRTLRNWKKIQSNGGGNRQTAPQYNTYGDVVVDDTTEEDAN